ncbi:hypothetical protein BKI52_33890 [marine bacterium AO1-C]|nr:hypothetical protein BKI52_33890 [marine bacterium AO1-C]
MQKHHINHYLLNNSSEVDQMILNIRSLLANNDSDKVILGLSLLQNGGVPSRLVTYLFVLSRLHSNYQIRETAQTLYYNWASEDLKKFIAKYYNKMAEWTSDETNVSRCLEKIYLHNDIDAVDLGQLWVKFRGKGNLFRLKNKIESTQEVLQSLYNTKTKTLVLSDLQLTRLPEEVTLFDVEHLYLDGNLFKKLPKYFYQFKNLKYINYYWTPLKKSTLVKIQKHYPQIVMKAYPISENFEESYALGVV